MDEQPEGSSTHYYTRQENGIHEFVFKVINRNAVQFFFNQLDAIYQNTPPNQRIMILVDARKSDPPPIQEMRRRSHDLEKKYPAHLPTIVAILHNPNPIASLMLSVVRVSRIRTNVLFFGGNRQAAVEWLLMKRNTETAETL